SPFGETISVNDPLKEKRILDHLTANNTRPRPFRFLSYDPTTLNIGSFLFEKQLGLGADGEVDQYRDPLDNTTYAIKRIDLDIDNQYNPPKRHLFLPTELQAWIPLAHPNILPLLAWGFIENTKQWALVISFAKYGSLTQYAQMQIPMALKTNIWKSRYSEIFHALAYLHSKGWLHNDLRNVNILVMHDFSLVISDFGQAKPVRDHHHKCLDSKKLTIAYFNLIRDNDTDYNIFESLLLKWENKLPLDIVNDSYWVASKPSFAQMLEYFYRWHQ
ncbi:Serine/threonine-protein kinase BLUS1, partial [Neolecta irregularis DAH-3]